MHACVSTFHFTTSNFVDMSSTAPLSRLTGGQLYHYANAAPESRDVWGPKLQASRLSRPCLEPGVR